MSRNKMGNYKLVMPIQQRFCDTDAMGHVNNATYLSYFELARVEYWKKVLGLKDYGDVDFILGRASVEFLSPVKLFEEISIGVRLTEMRGASFDFEYTVWAAAPGGSKREAARGLTTQVMYDYKKAKPTRIPEELRERVLKFEQGSKRA